MQGQYDLHQTGRAGRGLGVADHRFYRAEGAAVFIFVRVFQKPV